MGYSEKEINTIVKKSFGKDGFGFKISDPPKSAATCTQKNPFDGFGVIDIDLIKDYNFKQQKAYENKYVPLYWESKFSKELSAFALKRIEEHQAYYLNHTLKLRDTFSVVPFGVYVKRGEVRIYLFDWEALTDLYKREFSIHKKFLEKLPYNKVIIKDGTFSIDHIIIKDDLNKVYGYDIYEEKTNANDII